MPIAHGRLLADRIPGARMIELSGSDHAIWTEDADVIVGEIEHLLTGSRAKPESDRVLATVLFTDIVESTRRAADFGDAAWRRLLDQHDELVREQVPKSGGRVVKSLGDGILAVFPGPARAIDCAQALVTRRRRAGPPAAGRRAHRRVRGARRRSRRHGRAHRSARRRAGRGGQILSRRRSSTWSSGRACSSPIAENTSSRACPARGASSQSAPAPTDERRQVEPAGRYMTGADRLAVRLARRAPGVMQTLGRLAQRNARPAARRGD